MHFLLAVAATAPEAPAAAEKAFDWIGPIAGTGMVGVFLLMTILRIKIMPTYVYDDAKSEWDRQRLALEKDVDELKATLREANTVYTRRSFPL